MRREGRENRAPHAHVVREIQKDDEPQEGYVLQCSCRYILLSSYGWISFFSTSVG